MQWNGGARGPPTSSGLKSMSKLLNNKRGNAELAFPSSVSLFGVIRSDGNYSEQKLTNHPLPITYSYLIMIRAREITHEQNKK